MLEEIVPSGSSSSTSIRESAPAASAAANGKVRRSKRQPALSTLLRMNSRRPINSCYPLNCSVRTCRHLKFRAASGTRGLVDGLGNDALRRLETVDRLQIISGQYGRDQNTLRRFVLPIYPDRVSLGQITIENQEGLLSVLRVDGPGHIQVGDLAHAGNFIGRGIHHKAQH